MLISISELLKLENSEKQISLEIDLSGVSFSPLHIVFKAPLLVEGKLRYAGGVITLEATASGTYATLCDRCGSEMEQSIRFDIRENYVRKASAELHNSEELVVLEGQEIDLLDCVSSFAFGAIPPKHLCKEDCKGLCDKCGRNLNVEACSCKDDEWDPRFEALRGLFD